MVKKKKKEKITCFTQDFTSSWVEPRMVLRFLSSQLRAHPISKCPFLLFFVLPTSGTQSILQEKNTHMHTPPKEPTKCT